MQNKYYFDTAIWIDLLEDRKGFNGESLGKYAWQLLSYIHSINGIIFISDVVITELKNYSKYSEFIDLINLFKPILIKSSIQQRLEASYISNNLDLPTADALHAIIARDHNLILITRDNHFKKLVHISFFYKPEDLI